jgi:sugar phosphate isomerase/epimerase
MWKIPAFHRSRILAHHINQGGAMNISRRDVLKLGLGAAALAAGGCAQSAAKAAKPDDSEKTVEPAAKPTVPASKPIAKGDVKKIPIAVQLYSLRNSSKQNNPDTFKALADMGYRGVEFYSPYMDNKAEDLRKMLDDAKIAACGAHTNLQDLQGDNWKTTVNFNKTIGNKFLILPSLPGNYLSSEESIKSTAKLLTEMGDKAKEEGMRVGYHAHDGDFRKIGDLTIWEILFNAAGPDAIAQIDLGHCTTGGGDPVAMLKKFASRATSIHITDGRRPGGANRGRGAIVGEGDVKWDEVFQIIDESGKTDWLIVEQETYLDSSGKTLTPMESVKKDIEFLQKLGR